MEVFLQKIKSHSSLILCLGWIILGCYFLFYTGRSVRSITAGSILTGIGIIYGIFYFVLKRNP